MSSPTSSDTHAMEITARLQKLRHTQATNQEAAQQWTRNYQGLCQCFRTQWIELAIEQDTGALLTMDVQQLCSTWWVFCSLTCANATKEDAAACVKSLLQAGQPLLLLSMSSTLDEAQRMVLQSAARETFVVWDSVIRATMEKTEQRLASHTTLLPPWRAVSHLCDLAAIVEETALLLPTPSGTSAQDGPCPRREALSALAEALHTTSVRIAAAHANRVFHDMLYPSFHPVQWQSERVLESSMTRVAGVHPCVWMLFSLCRLCLRRARVREAPDEPRPNRGAALIVCEYVRAFVVLIEDCLACPADAWQEDVVRRRAFLTDVYVTVLLCRLLRGVVAVVDTQGTPYASLLEASLRTVIHHTERMDRTCCYTSARDGQAAPLSTNAALSESEWWQTDVWSVAPLTVDQIVDRTSNAPWSASFAAADVMSSLLVTCASVGQT